MTFYLNIGVFSAIQLFLFKAGIQTEQTVDASTFTLLLVVISHLH